MHSSQLVWVKIPVIVKDAPNTLVRHASRLSVLSCRSPRTATEGRQNSGHVLGCANGGRPTRCRFTRDSALTVDGLHLEMWLYIASFHGETHASLSLHPNNQFHSTHTQTHPHSHTHIHTPTHTHTHTPTHIHTPTHKHTLTHTPTHTPTHKHTHTHICR